MEQINVLLAERLKILGASQIPASVLSSIQDEVDSWREELTQKAQARLQDRVQRLITKPFIARHFANQFRKPIQVQETAHE